MRIRLQASGSTTSPKTALEILCRIQQHQVAIGDHAYRGVSTTTPEQLALFDALTLPKP